MPALQEAQARNVLQFHQRTLVELVAAQMRGHYSATAASYDMQVNSGYVAFPELNYSATESSPRNFRTPVGDRSRIRGVVFDGFHKCLYPRLKFDSDPERRFAIILEDDPTVEKWVRPPAGIPRIEYEGRAYEADFIAETAAGLFLSCWFRRVVSTPPAHFPMSRLCIRACDNRDIALLFARLPCAGCAAAKISLFREFRAAT